MPESQGERIHRRIELARRESRNRHPGGVLWFTGLSGAGKSTLAFALEARLFEGGYQVYVLDGDNLRGGLSSDLRFTHIDRTENIRRAGQVAALFADAGLICIAAFISPYRSDRATAAMNAKRFHEIYIRADLTTCERRDPKGLYKLARAGEIKNFTAIDDVYEEPEHPAFVVDTTELSIEQSLGSLSDFVAEHFPLGPPQPTDR
ncbi:MAG: adenylyl-sulfate kinase [Gammaproteobacteria bacterium]|nr:adenylyl-sulfate kinase [Gammaproteobacteria bacterium]